MPQDENGSYTQSKHRTFETVSDRNANSGLMSGKRRQRSYSVERTYASGEIRRIHVHDNARSGGKQFTHCIGGWDQNGNYSGRHDGQETRH